MSRTDVSTREELLVEEKRLRRDVGRVGLLFAGVGSIIGSGWLFGALTASQIAGPAAIVSWVLAGFMVMLIGLCYAELGAMLPVSGGVVRYPHYSFGSLTSYTGGWITWIAAVTTAPIEVLATLTYATNYVPCLTDEKNGVAVLTAPGYGVAVVLMFLFCLINVVGVRAFARFNTVRQLPERERPFRLPGGDTIPLLAFIASNLIVFCAGWETNYKLLICIVAGYLLLAGYHRFGHDPAPLEWRAGSWLAPWLIGLMLISALGDFGDGLDVLSLGWGALAVAFLSFGIYALAIRVRLPRARVVTAIKDTPHEEPHAV